MRTFLQVQEDIFVQLKQEKGTDIYWGEQEVKDSVNDIYIDIADTAMCFRLDHIIEVKVGIRAYKLPENYVYGSMNRVEFDGEPIYPVTSMELDAYSHTWRTEEGDPRYYLPPGDISQYDEIAVYPKPDTAGAVYNLASGSADYGVIVNVGDTSYEEFNSEEGVIVDTDGNARFEELAGSGPVLQILDPNDNLRIFGARYPVRLFNDTDVFLSPITYNPQKILTKGSLAILYAKDGEGKDIAKASFYNKRYEEAKEKIFGRGKIKKIHRMRSISEVSIGGYGGRGLNLGANYPVYVR